MGRFLSGAIMGAGVMLRVWVAFGDWSAKVDGYCERTDLTYWSEPANALSNASFIAAALIVWRLARRVSDRPAQVLAVAASGIGVGSFLFHTHASLWALQADVWPIRLFAILFVGFATIRLFGTAWWAGGLAAVSFVPFSIGMTTVASRTVGHLHGSVGYLPVLLVLVVFATTLWRSRPDIAWRLLAGGMAFGVSLAFRTIDGRICGAVPIGTHFVWHLLNGLVVGWLIFVFMRAGCPERTGPVRSAVRCVP